MFISVHPKHVTKVDTISIFEEEQITGFAKFDQLDWINSMKILFKGLCSNLIVVNIIVYSA